jgi:MFS family permease
MKIMRNLLALYLPIAALMLCIFLGGFLADSSSSKSDAISWVAVFVGSALFPLVIPIALIERLLKARLPQPARLSKDPRYSIYRERTITN